MHIRDDIKINLSEKKAHEIIIESLFKMGSITQAQYQKGLEIIQKKNMKIDHRCP